MASLFETLKRFLKIGSYKPYTPEPRDVAWDPAWHHNLEGTRNVTADALIDNDDTREEIGRMLEKEGLRYLPMHAYKSGISLVVDFIHDQTLRITKKSEIKYQPLLKDFDPPLFLKAHVNIDTDDYLIEILPKISTQHVTTDHLKELIAICAQRGFLFWDAKLENIGLLPDGTPVILDSGAVIPLDKQEEIGAGDRTYLGWYRESLRETFKKKKSASNDTDEIKLMNGDKDYIIAGRLGERLLNRKPTMQYSWHGKQETYQQALGLEEGKIAGVFSDKDIARLVKTAGGKYTTIIRALLDGAYPDDLQKICKAATRRYLEIPEKDGQSWSNYVQQEFDTFKKTLPPQGRDNRRGPGA